ncbi:autotransporter outer membrane beta-barrel domain-containing protein [Escherichia coli]|uniref:autotransporter outer membrane beta-barrel domain-containing protein n=1 Tax=Escherichia coli TaxID=562 RepID=UPI002AC524C7|nr:autotransporter outer membrane beta-barrel domain-containing protein [Escherichia coli]MDZ4929962.1 autotransporter outer membrane beta-barrel domain-containing protein [Escherichia coli]MDZ4962044.1 autotransporter outer membrane beta-barrel domain-containing protein [Escherichia coli]
MNKVYSLKYSVLTGGLIAVSELARKVAFGTPRKIIAIVVSSLLAGISGTPAFSAMLDINKIWARDYLDLAQNRGVFQQGNTDAQVMMKDGNVFHFPALPIPDFSVVSNKGATTSIGGAYSVTATHNRESHHAITRQSWGQTEYNASNRVSSGDFSVNRLDKFVVETTGVTDSVDFSLSREDAMKRYGIIYDNKEQIIGFRVGSGTTSVIEDGKEYRFGKSYTPDLLSASLFSLEWNKSNITYSNKTPFKNSPIYGDSGSGSYLYDKELKKWVFHGVTSSIAFYHNTNILWSNHALYNTKIVNELKNSLTSEINLNGSKKELSVITKDKDLSLSGGGELVLNKNTDLGIGGIIFDQNENYKVSGDGVFYKGAGLDIGENTIVEWLVRGATGDNLHKIGGGILDVKVAQGTNLKTGNGTVVLSTDNAFDNIYVAGGKSTVRLNAKNALGNNTNPGIFFTRNGGTLDLNGYDLSFQKIAATDAGTTITNKNMSKLARLTLTNTDNYMYHGNITGNTHLIHSFENKNNDSQLIIDGNVDAQNIDIKNASLTLQGHATDHAIFRDGGVYCPFPDVKVFCDKDYAEGTKQLENKVNEQYNTFYKSNNQVADFSQPDWEDRFFNVRILNLENSSLTVGRNADVNADIIAKNSNINIGDKESYIDLYSGRNITGTGFSFRQDIRKGESTGISRFSGSLYATDKSKVTVGSEADVIMTGYTILMDSNLNIKDNGHLTTQRGLFSTDNIDIANGKLTMTGTPTEPVGEKITYTPAVNMVYGLFNLNSDHSVLEARNQAWVSGNIHSDKKASIIFGSENEASLTSEAEQLPGDKLLGGFETSYTGSIDAPYASASMYNTLWKVNGKSDLESLKTRNSILLFSNIENTGFHTVTVNKMDANNTAVVMRADLSQPVNKTDKLIIKNQLNGSNNSLIVDIQKVGNNNSGLSVDLITAPKGSNKDIFKAGTQSIGFSNISPVINTKDNQEHTTWTLTGYKVAEDTASSGAAKSYMSGNYKAFLTEVNNLNKRMGDLRDINGEAGAWVRIMSGAGSASGEYSDNYTHVQIGADKKHQLGGLDLFTGLTMTYTDSHASSNSFSGKTKSVGAGLYASAMFDSGAYIDLIGKYVYHDNEYTATFAGLGTRNYGTHSWYAGAETGYRYHLNESTWIEPQAELVYGVVSGKQFSWQDRGMNVTMKNKAFNPLIGRTGIDVGKTFSGKEWKVTAKAGIGYQFDLLKNGEILLRDASGEKRIKGEKDGRMLMNVGLNAEAGDNVRLGVEFEKSAFGKYNVDNSVNVNFRYSF